MDTDAVTRAQLAAMLSLGEAVAPLTRFEAAVIVTTAVHVEAVRLTAYGEPLDESRLTLVGIRAVGEAQAGRTERALLIARIQSLGPREKTAYSLRYEHGMSDAEIAEATNMTEDQVVSIMLRALRVVTGSVGNA